MRKKQQLTGGLLAIAIMCVCALGCGTGDPVGDAMKSANTNNISRVANVYGMFQMRNAENGYMGPKDEAEFKAFMQDPKNSETMANMGIEDIDGVFISDRDEEPIKIRWGVKGSSRGCYEPVAFESVGVDGARLVGFCIGTQEEVEDDTTYDDMFAGKYKPDTDRTKGGGIPKFDANGNEIK